MRFGITHGVDYVALSFVRTPQDILDARQAIEQLHAEHVEQAEQAGDQPFERVPLIAKLEKPEAIAHLDTILEVVDGVMVARGDLGVEMSPEKVPHIQKRPRTPILAYTPSPEVYRRLALWWGVWSYQAAIGHTTDELISVVEHHLIDNHLMNNGDHVVIMGGLPIASRARTNFVKLHRVDPDDPD